MIGTTTERITDIDVYVAEGTNFVKKTAGSTIPANSAYIEVGQFDVELGESFPIDSSASINEIISAQQDSTLYDIAGRRVAKTPANGIWILYSKQRRHQRK